MSYLFKALLGVVLVKPCYFKSSRSFLSILLLNERVTVAVYVDSLVSFSSIFGIVWCTYSPRSNGQEAIILPFCRFSEMASRVKRQVGPISLYLA